jgi:hypothetical protein
MKKLAIPNSVTRTFHKGLFQIKKHSPEILIVAGVIGTVASGVLACKATLKVNDVLDDAKVDIDKIHTAKEKGVTEAGKDYYEEDAQKDLTLVYVQTGVKLVKLYAPAVLLGAASITGIVASHRILTKRNVALATAYAAVDTGFKEYRSRVVERFGKDLDRELRYNIKAKEIEETIVDEDGNETVVKQTVEVADKQGLSAYARCFDETCSGWERDAEQNRFFLHQQQCWLNDKLQEKGYVTLNEAYEALGFPKTREGVVVGWVFDKNNPDCSNHIDFGLFDDIHNSANRLFINGYEKSVWLDFNVDGYIYDLMK